MAAYAQDVWAAGARFIGGCCGSGPEHIAAMAEALKEAPAQAVTIQSEPASELAAKGVASAAERAARRAARRIRE
jgi:pyrroline-5-carboxylate reductase